MSKEVTPIPDNEVERLKMEAAAAEDRRMIPGVEPTPPDMADPADVRRWFGEYAIRRLARAVKESHLARLRAAAQAFTAWVRLSEHAQADQVSELTKRLDELEARLERTGPTGVVHGE